MAAILIVYSTVDGQTRRICERLARVLTAETHTVTLLEVRRAAGLDIRPFDRVVIGASIRYGKHRREVHRFVAANLAQLRSKPSAFFSVNLEARKPAFRLPETNPYTRKFLAASRWHPSCAAAFAGRLDYSLYGFLDRLLLRAIMRMTGGPTAGHTEYTDWEQVDAFARCLGGIGSRAGASR